MADTEEALAAATTIEADATVDYILDKDLRTVAVPARGAVLGVEGDNDTNHVRFEAPQMYKGNDLSTFDVSIIYINANGDAGQYSIGSPTASDGTISFEWLVAALAVAYRGDVTFAVNFVKGDLAYNSTIATATCLEGIESEALSDIDAESLLSQLLAAQSAANAATSSANSAASAANSAASSAKSTESDIETAEAKRVASESSRVSAESSRVSAENSRVSAENGRVTAESSRVTAESTRQSDFEANLDDWQEQVNALATDTLRLSIVNGRLCQTYVKE